MQYLTPRGSGPLALTFQLAASGLVLAAGTWGCDSEHQKANADTGLGSEQPATITAGDAGDASDESEAGSRNAGPAPLSSCGPSIGRSTCDPISAWPCDLEGGETCDFSHAFGGFKCLPPPNEGRFCDPCDIEAELFCGPGTTCGPGKWCDRYCCADSDCARGRCVLGGIDDPSVASVGYCDEEGRVTCGGEAPDTQDAGKPRPASDAGQ